MAFVTQTTQDKSSQFEKELCSDNDNLKFIFKKNLMMWKKSIKSISLSNFNSLENSMNNKAMTRKWEHEV